ncbi:MAG: AAA family ATPase [Fibrobacteraceae bacterium]|nr:AAA family ATPase [Fibrobacteraceae bacterium]
MIEYRLNGPASWERQRIRLMASLGENRFPQAILIDGPAGIGKKLMAMEIARALQCTDPNIRPCGRCFACKMAVDAGATDNWVFPMISKEANAKSAADVSAGSTAKTVQDFKKGYIETIMANPYGIDTFSTAASISVDMIRNMTGSFALRGMGVRVIIVAEADRMNDSAANALLKTLEEVPTDTYFILTTSSREKLLQTIRSRCLALHLVALSDDEVRSEMEKYLEKEDLTNDGVPDDVVGLAMGSVGKALYYMETAKKWSDLSVSFVQKSLSLDYSDLYFEIDEADIEDADNALRFLEVLSFLICDLMRQMAGTPLRIPETTDRVHLQDYPLVNLPVLETSLLTVQETMSRVASRRTSVSVCLQSLAIKLFEGAK